VIKKDSGEVGKGRWEMSGRKAMWLPQSAQLIRTCDLNENRRVGERERTRLSLSTPLLHCHMWTLIVS